MGKIAKLGKPCLPWRELKGRFLQLLDVIVTGYAINHRSRTHFLCHFTKIMLAKNQLNELSRSCFRLLLKYDIMKY